MKINVKCLFKLRGEKGKLYLARIMFKHSLDIEAAFSADSVNFLKI